MTIQKSSISFFKRRPPRRFHIYCVGAAKTGTTTVAEMFKGEYRAEHEPETEPTNQFVIDFLEKKMDAEVVEKYLLSRDRRLNLELESAHPLGYTSGMLAGLFPEAKFIITVREPYSWLESRLNYHYQKNPVAWRSYRKYFWTDRQHGYPDEEKILAECELCSLDVYLAQYADHYRRVLSSIPEDRRLVVKTHELTDKLPEIAGFAGIPEDTLKLTHSKRSLSKFQPLKAIEPSYTRQKIWSHCYEMIGEFFPELAGDYQQFQM